VVAQCTEDGLLILRVLDGVLLKHFVRVRLEVVHQRLAVHINNKLLQHRHAFSAHASSALTLLVGRQEGHPAFKKLEWWGAGMVICLERGADLYTAQLMSLPLTVSCFSKIQIGFTFLVPTYLGSPGKRAIKHV